MSKSFAVLGSPISHSKSPIIHQAAYRVLGEDWKYSSFEIQKGGLKRFIDNDVVAHSGFSLTMPLKENAFQFADFKDELSQLTKASNTLVKQEDGWHAYNTDVFGIRQAVNLNLSTSLQQSLIIGSGATATSALVAISILAPKSRVSIFARNKSTRAELILLGTTLGLVMSKARFLSRAIKQADLTISTLPGGALDDAVSALFKKKSLVPGGLLLDVAYHPWPSSLASLWISRSKPVVSGLEMLLWQAVSQIRIFKFGNPDEPLPNEIAVVEAMRIALEQ